MMDKWVRLLGIGILIMAVISPNLPAAALGQSNVLSNGQFVYGPNVGDFDLSTYLAAHAPHLSQYADDLYGRAQYHGINPKLYLTLLEIHSHLVSAENMAALENPLGVDGTNFMAQIDTISQKMTGAYYAHLYNAPVSADTNAGTDAIIAALTAMGQQNISVLLDNTQADGFYQTYRRLFDDDPLDESNRVDLPGELSAQAAPDNLLQLPYLRGLAWKFGGVHDTSGCSGLGSNGCQFTDASAIDMYPLGSTWGMDTSAMWVVAAAAGTPTRVSACQYKITYADGWETDYYHLENTLTYPGGTIQQNDKIGVIANTEAEATCNGGSASGPHVHFWLRHNGVNVALNGTPLAGWYVHSGRWSYDTDPKYMWLEKAGVKKYPYSDTILSENPGITFKTTSIGAQDGWVLETGENSNKGGTKNATDGTLRLGDDVAQKQYISILTFNTGDLPDTAVIKSITLKLKKQGVTGGGNPVSFLQGFMVGVKNGVFGTAALQSSDFNATVNQMLGPFKTALSGNFYNINISSAKSHINLLTGSGGLTQIRLRFKLDDNDDRAANYLKLYSGNAALADRPQLIINYIVP